ncbi:thioredoxin domain-containing protein [Pedobacter sp. R20-19]|uniref:thioredoxin domain-containing protein n=1 Tax=Pedobacter sp. R20-19 TaxID=1270196 RepID=UPI00049334EF|nr:thioredoxin domain-containing protein [Pedobacter sp. R20-19]
MIKKITASAVRALLCLKTFRSDSVKRIAEDTIAEQIARYQTPPILKEKIGKGKGRSMQSRELSLMAELSFAEIKLEWLKRSKEISILLLFLLGNISAHAQNIVKEVMPQEVGRKLPESFWTQEHAIYANGKTTRQTLSAYKNQLLVLDFWATWCSSCTHKFKYIDSLQKEYEGRAVVLLVDAKSTRDTPEKIALTMNRFNNQLMTVVADTTLSKYFVHTTVPHYIWIAGGYLLATSGSEFMQKSNFNSILDRQRRLKEGAKSN